MNEAAFSLLLALCGYGLFLRLTKGRNPALGLACAFPLGALQWVGLAILSVIAGAPLLVTLPATALLALFHLGAAWKRGAAPVKSWALPGLAGSAALLALGWIPAQWGWGVMSYDSVEQIAIGKAFAMAGLGNDMGPQLASWGVLVPLLQGASFMLGTPFYAAMQPLFALSLAGLFGAGLWALHPPANKAGRLRAGTLIVLGIGFLASTYFMVFQSVYVHNSLPAATFLMLFATGVGLSLRRGAKESLSLAFCGLIGFMLCRTEAALFASLALVLAASVVENTPVWQAFRRLTLLYTGLTTLWFAGLLAVIGSGSDILTPDRLFLLFGVTAGAALFVLCPGTWARRLRKVAPEGVLLGGLAALVGGFMWKPALFTQNVSAIAQNLFLYGRWGVSWGVILLMMPLALGLSSGRRARALTAFLIAFAIQILLLGLLRVPYRLGWGDSANRIFTILLPLALWGCIGSLRTAGRTDADDVEKTALSFPRALTMGFLFAFSLLLPVGLIGLHSWQAAPPLRVLQAEGFCPPDATGAYGFEQALGPASPETYAAACGQGLRRVELELKRPRPLRAIELEEYAPTEQWTAFALRVSSDGRNWQTAFDTKAGGAAPSTARISPTLWRISLAGLGEIRFIELDYRASAGQNRLLLRHLGILE